MSSARELFEKHTEEFCRFERIENPKCKRPDLYAMTILDRLCPGDGDLIIRTDFDSFTFSISVDQLEGIATMDDYARMVEAAKWEARVHGLILRLQDDAMGMKHSIRTHWVEHECYGWPLNPDWMREQRESIARIEQEIVRLEKLIEEPRAIIAAYEMSRFRIGGRSLHR